MTPSDSGGPAASRGEGKATAGSGAGSRSRKEPDPDGGPSPAFDSASWLKVAKGDGSWNYGFLFSAALTVGGGTSEVQRNIMAQRVLGLPR